jgi:protein angel
MKQPYLIRDNIGLALLLKAKHKSSDKQDEATTHLCVATTHILYNPKRGDIKLAQLQLLLSNIDRLAFRSSRVTNDGRVMPQYYPTVLCGDFNCVNESKLYEFLATSRLENYKELNRNVLSGQFGSSRISNFITELLPKHLGISDQSQYVVEVNKRLNAEIEKNKASLEDANANFNFEVKSSCTQGSEHLAHNFAFKSVYKHYDEVSGSPEVTTCVHGEKRTVDYIFYHSENLNGGHDDDYDDDDSGRELRLIGRLELFTMDALDGVVLPERNYPSDHFVLAAKFALGGK